MNRTKFLKILAIALIPISLLFFSSYRNSQRKIKKIVIDYIGTENIYITDQNIRQILFKGIEDTSKITLNQLKINDLETRLDANPMIEDTEIYLTIDGVLKAKIRQRKPIARVFDGGKFYYLDLNGKQMPLSNAYSARVPIVTGVFDQSNISDIYTLAHYIYQDHFLSENIIQIDVDKNFFYLKMRIADFDVILGDVSHLKIKFNNLKAFYKKASKDKILNKYKQVNLQYSNQVVCTQ